jgi:glycosyltransferase involved in cell wall biosynthesis
MMKIAFILPSLKQAGPVNVVFDLVTLLIANGHRCEAFYFDELSENIHQFPCQTRKITMRSKIHWDEFDVVHSHGLRCDAFVFIHKPWFRRIRTLFVSTMHNFVISDLRYEYNRLVAVVAGNLWMLMVSRHDKIAVLTNVAKNYYSKWHNPAKLYVAYNTRIINRSATVSREELVELQKFKGQSPFLGVNCYLTPIKGIDLILKSMPFIGSDVKLLIVGEGPDRQRLQKMASELNIEDRVYFAGYKADAYRYLPLYDLYLMPSKSEGFSLALLEAAEYSRNIICSDIPVFREIFTDDEVTFFEPENAQSLAAAIMYALNNPKGEAAYQRYARDYTPEQFLNRYLAIYKH